MLEDAHNNGINIVLIHDYSESKKTVLVEEIFKKYCGNKDTLISGQFGSAAVARNEGLKVCKKLFVLCGSPGLVVIPWRRLMS